MRKFIEIIKIFLLIVYIVKQKQKMFVKFIKIFYGFSKFSENRIFEILIIYKPSQGPCEVPYKIWARSVQPFYRLLDGNRQTNRQANFFFN